MSLYDGTRDRTRPYRPKEPFEGHPDRKGLNRIVGWLKRSGISIETINNNAATIIALHAEGRTWREIAEAL